MWLRRTVQRALTPRGKNVPHGQNAPHALRFPLSCEGMMGEEWTPKGGGECRGARATDPARLGAPTSARVACYLSLPTCAEAAHRRCGADIGQSQQQRWERGWGRSGGGGGGGGGGVKDQQRQEAPPQPAPSPLAPLSDFDMEIMNIDPSLRGRVPYAGVSQAARSWARRQMTRREYRYSTLHCPRRACGQCDALVVPTVTPTGVHDPPPRILRSCHVSPMSACSGHWKPRAPRRRE